MARLWLPLVFLLTSCASFHVEMLDPQVWVDLNDTLRERNERGSYREAVDILNRLGAPYCDFDASTFNYPVTFPILGIEYATYHTDSNAIVYPLGDHDKLIHEMAHAVTFKQNSSQECLHQIAATATQNYETVREFRSR